MKTLERIERAVEQFAKAKGVSVTKEDRDTIAAQIDTQSTSELLTALKAGRSLTCTDAKGRTVIFAKDGERTYVSTVRSPKDAAVRRITTTTYNMGQVKAYVLYDAILAWTTRGPFTVEEARTKK